MIILDRTDKGSRGEPLIKKLSYNDLNRNALASQSEPLIKKLSYNDLNRNALASQSLPIISGEPTKQSKSLLFFLDKIAIGTEFFFTALFSMEIVVKEIAFLGHIGFFLGISYAVIQTYLSCFNYYFDCFYKDKPLTDIQKKIFTIIAIVFGVFCSVSWFLSSMSYGLILYHFDFLHYSHAHSMVFAFSVLAASVTTIGTISHITYNLSKIKSNGKSKDKSEALGSRDEVSKSKGESGGKKVAAKKIKDKVIDGKKNHDKSVNKELKSDKKNKPTNTVMTNFFMTTQKVGWFFRVINFGFLLSTSFHWYGFILGASLTIIDIYDNSVFLSSCDSRDKHKFENKEAFYAFAIRYLFASGFTIGYTSYVVYLNLTYFAWQYLATPGWLNISYSVITAACGAFAGLMYRCKVFQKIRAKFIEDNQAIAIDNLNYRLLAEYIILFGRCSLWCSSRLETAMQDSSKVVQLKTP